MTKTAITKTAMTKTAALLAALAGMLLCTLPAQAQGRVFVSGSGVDTNPCTFAAPCRSFQQAYNTAAANSEIDVLDPAGYGPLTISSYGISIQGHGFSGVTQTGSCLTCAAITISVTTTDPVSLNGLLLDGGGTGYIGINITSGNAVQILDCVIRHFDFGIFDKTTTTPSKLLIEDTVTSDNSVDGILLDPGDSIFQQATLKGVTANNNQFGVVIAGADGLTTIASSVMSNNSTAGLQHGTGTVWLGKSVISGNATGVVANGTVNSYQDNEINNNATPVGGSVGTLALVSKQ